MNHVTTVSAIFWTGGLDPWASSTILMIRESIVSAPTRLASNVRLPVVARVPATTSSPGSLSAGMGSPVTMDSSTKLEPDVTIPSTGILSPGLMTTLSPISTFSTGTWISSSPLMTAAVSDWSLTRACIADEVLPFALVSRYLPSMRNEVSMMAVSYRM